MRSMIDLFLRVAFYLIGGLALAGACAWYVQSPYQTITGRGEVVIAPFEVIGPNADKNRGVALAHMLHSRLGEIERDLRTAQSELSNLRQALPLRTALTASVAKAGTGAADTGTSSTASAMPQLLTQPVELRAGLLEPADINISMGGVQVGGVVYWAQRLISSPRTLVFTLYESKEGAQLSGSLQSLGMRDEGVRIVMAPGTGQDAVPIDRVVEQAAYEIIRRRLALDASNKVEVLTSLEFQGLVEALRDTAALNRRVALGRGALPEFQDVLAKVSRLADDVPEWFQLNYLVGSVAESAKDLDAASKNYARVVEVVGREPSQAAFRDKVQARLNRVNDVIVASSATEAGADASTTTAQKKIETYAATATGLLNALLGHHLPIPHVKVGKDRGASYWDGRNIVIPAAAQDLPDIAYREASWPHIMRIAGSGVLDADDGSMEAILYSYADIFPIVVQQRVLKQNEKTSPWELAPGWVEMFEDKDLATSKTKTPYLSFAQLGADRKSTTKIGYVHVGHMRDFDTKSDRMQRKYINSGILDKAFYEAALLLGTAKAADIWVGALRQLPSERRVDFPRYAAMLNDAAPEGDRALLRKALQSVGLDPEAKAFASKSR